MCIRDSTYPDDGENSAAGDNPVGSFSMNGRSYTVSYTGRANSTQITNTVSEYRDGGLLLPGTERATHWLELAAKQNLPAAQYALGELYLSDDPEVHDVDDGLRWLEQAARNGNTDAAYRLGKEYLTGKAVQKDAVKAAEYLRYAADQNHPCLLYTSDHR